jgi:hypothetical protein
MVRDRRYKLVAIRGTSEMHLYDLGRDPHEMRDLIDAPESRPEADRLGARLDAWEAGRD